jgi:hypothetical protein
MAPRSLLVNLKLGPLVGMALGLIVSVLAVSASTKSGMGRNNATGRIYVLFMTAFLPYILSGGIGGLLSETLFIEKLILSSQFLAKHKIGSIIGCILGGIFSFYLLLSFGTIGGILLGGLTEEIFGTRFALSGMFLGTMLTSLFLILSFSFVGLFLGALADKLISMVL